MTDTAELVDPLEASRHPFETYLLALAVVSGIPLLFGSPISGSIEEALPPVLVHGWGAMLVLGSGLALVGSYWRGRPVTGLVMERTGLVGVGGASMVHSASVFVVAPGWSGAFAACITGGFGLACLAQARRISTRLRIAIHQVHHP